MLDQMIAVYYIVFAEARFDELHVAEFKAVAKREGLNIELINGYIPQIALFTATNCTDDLLDRVCNGVTACRIFGRVISFTESPEDVLHNKSMQLVTKLCEKLQKRTFSMESHFLGRVVKQEEKLDILEDIYKRVNFPMPKADLKNPEFHL